MTTDLQLDLFEEALTMVRPTDEAPAHDAADGAVFSNEANRRLILRLLVRHGWMTQFCPFVLMRMDARYKQTAIGPRFAKLKREGLIELIEKRIPRAGAETRAPVSTYQITAAGRLFLERCDEAAAGCGYLTGPQRGDA